MAQRGSGSGSGGSGKVVLGLAIGTAYTRAATASVNLGCVLGSCLAWVLCLWVGRVTHVVCVVVGGVGAYVHN